MLIDKGAGKNFEKPNNGLFLGVLADVQYVKDQPSANGPKDVVRLFWILDKKDSEGNHFRVMTQANQTMGENGRLYAIIKDIQLGTPPSCPFDPDSLIGTVRQLVVAIETSNKIDPRTGAPKTYANIKAYLATTPGQTFAIPAGFVRAKDKPVKGTQPAQQAAPASVANTAPVQTAASVQSEEIPF